MSYSQKKKAKVKCRICGVETNDYTLSKVPGTNKTAWVCKWHVVNRKGTNENLLS